jgi:hypothetical protein
LLGTSEYVAVSKAAKDGGASGVVAIDAIRFVTLLPFYFSIIQFNLTFYSWDIFIPFERRILPNSRRSRSTDDINTIISNRRIIRTYYSTILACSSSRNQ